MNRYVFFLCLLTYLLPVRGQVYSEFTPMPRVMETPSWSEDEMDWNDRGSDPWWVYADRNDVKLFSDESCTTLKGTANFLEPFMVWEESANALRVVSPADLEKELVTGTVFSENAIDRGWVKKEHVIMWQKTLMKDRVLMKAIVSGDLNSSLYDPDKPAAKIKVPENEFRIYNVVKEDNSSLLLMGTDVLHRNMVHHLE